MRAGRALWMVVLLATTSRCTVPPVGIGDPDGGQDAGQDAGVPSSSDAGSDAGNSTSSDAGSDAGNSTSGDAGNDAGNSTSGDAGNDAGQDAGGSTSGDAGNDAGQDAGASASSDAGNDAGQDAGDGGTPSGLRYGFNGQYYVWDSGISAADESALIRSFNGRVHRWGVQWKWLQQAQTDPPLPAGHIIQDEIYAENLDAGILPVVLLLDAPGWASAYPSCLPVDLLCKENQQRDRLPPANDAAWRTFTAAVAARFPQAVIEPWNEPNLNAFWNPTPPDAGWMGRLQCAAYDAVKAQNPNQLVAAPGFNNRLETSASDVGILLFLEMMVRSQRRVCWDVLSFHVYHGSDFLPDGGSAYLDQLITGLRAVRADAGDSSPFWVTETGETTTGPNGYSETGQRDKVATLVQWVESWPETQVVLFHALRDGTLPPIAGSASLPSHAEYGYGLLRVDLSPKPAGCWVSGHTAGTVPGCP